MTSTGIPAVTAVGIDTTLGVTMGLTDMLMGSNPATVVGVMVPTATESKIVTVKTIAGVDGTIAALLMKPPTRAYVSQFSHTHSERSCLRV